MLCFTNTQYHSQKKYGWEYCNKYCGHLIRKFPHEKIVGENVTNYLQPDNHQLLSDKDNNGNERYWIYEIHFINLVNQIDTFHVQMLY